MSLQFTHIKGDTFDEVAFQLKINDDEVNLTGAVIKMQLRKCYTDTTAALSLAFKFKALCKSVWLDSVPVIAPHTAVLSVIST